MLFWLDNVIRKTFWKDLYTLLSCILVAGYEHGTHVCEIWCSHGTVPYSRRQQVIFTAPSDLTSVIHLTGRVFLTSVFTCLARVQSGHKTETECPRSEEWLGTWINFLYPSWLEKKTEPRKSVSLVSKSVCQETSVALRCRTIRLNFL
jgi:hypothetical protein